ncbi:hypothetical protein LSCM1_08058 [Leishmania martiniquensis]|uniref:N-acetyltransferase ESCO zinc-finger domain-containing protein n=1 Tax=Leishmania martiniquensis TaxID=1580590 RepID=A0A836HP10_9TRYP|nr:hypothetical protein LSCM1_08058 [Leishmania martiniquensis]
MSPAMPPSLPARHCKPTLAALFASATRKRQAAESPLSMTTLSPPADSVHRSTRAPARSSIVATNGSGKEVLLSGEVAEAPAGTAQQRSTKASSSFGSGSDDDDGTDMLVGELLFGTDGGLGADSSPRGCSPPAAPPASLSMTAPVSSPPTAPGGHLPRPRSNRRPPRLTQATLDLGQAALAIATRCTLCGMLYTAEDDEDAALHRRFCRGRERIRRRGGGPCDAPSSLAAASRGRRVRRETSATSVVPIADEATVAVRMLEELSCKHAGHSLSPPLSNTATTPQQDGPRHRVMEARGAAKATRAATSTLNSAGDAAAVFCACVICPLSSASSPRCPSPLEVFHLSFDACGLTEGQGARTALSLLELLDFTPVVLRAAAAGIAARQTELPPVLSGSVSEAPAVNGSAVSDMLMVCVVDVVLRKLLCAVIGEPRRREQDPELCVEQRADGTTVCRTRRHFTYGDVAGLWLCSLAELSAAQETWEKNTAAPFASTRQALKNFFGARAGVGAASLRQSRAAHIAEKARVRCQEATGVALHTLAQHLVYGSSLSPLWHLSYAQAALTPSVASLGADFIQQSVAVVSSCYPAGATPKPREDTAEPQPLYMHAEDKSGSDSDHTNEGGAEVSGE